MNRRSKEMVFAAVGAIVWVVIGSLSFGFLVGSAHASGYQYVRSITVSTSTAIASGTNANFPMLVSSQVSSWEASSTGGRIQNLCSTVNGTQEPCDLVFSASPTCASGYLLNFETENYSPSTGDLIDWVNVPLLSAGTSIYACYDNSSVTTDQSHSSSTWSSNYTGVWHFASTSSTVPSYLDSTPNGDTGVWFHAPPSMPGAIDGGVTLNGSNQNIQMNSSTPFGLTAGTFSMWVNANAFGGVLAYEDGGNLNAFSIAFPNSSTGTTAWGLDYNSGSNVNYFSSTKNNFATGTWYLYTLTWNAPSSTANLYINGVLDTSYSTAAYPTGAGGESNSPGSGVSTTVFGSFAYGGNENYSAATGGFFNGSIDETRFLNVPLSSQWVLTEYNNQNNPSTFYSIGGEQAPSNLAAPVISNIASAPTGNSAVITWTTDAGADTLVNYGTSTTYSASSTYSSAYVTSHSVTLTGLTPNTTYHFQVVSSNGLASTSSDQTFMTATPVISNIASAPSGNAAAITWTTNLAADSLVNYGTSTNYTASSTYSSALVTSHSVVLSGLTPSTTYHYQVVSSNGAVTTSSDQTFTTVPATYQYYVPITVSTSTAIASGTNTNFPMLVSSTLPQWIYPGHRIKNLATAPNGGQEPADLVFATSTANCGMANLGFETESYTSSTGALVDWVNVPTMSAGTVIYVCYGNASVTLDQSNPVAAWNSTYKGVWHLPGATGALNTNDSTANKNNGTNNGATTAVGEIDGGAGLNGSNYISVPMTINYPTLTVETWFNSSNLSLNNPRVIANSHTDGGFTGFQLQYNNGGGSGFFDVGNGSSDIAANWTKTLTPNTWYDYIGTYNGTNAKAYINGLLVGSSTNTSGSVASSGFNLNFGRNPAYGGDYFPGNVDEVRVLNTAVSSSWILTEYNNQNSPSSFYTVGTEESSNIPPVISNVSGNGAVITWTTDVGADSLVNYGTSTTYSASSTYSSTYVTSHSVTLSGLSPSTTYHFQVVSSDGILATSTDQTFTTGASMISAVSSTPSGASAVIAWTTDAPADSLVNYGTSTTYSASSTYSSTYVTSHSVTLTGLTPSTTYHYQVVSSNGFLATSSDQVFTTVTPVVSNISSNSGLTTSTIAWTTSLPADSLVNYGTSTTYTVSSTYSGSLVTSHSVTLTGLLPNVMYHFQVVSSNGAVVTSTDQTFTTGALTVSNALWSGAAITWTTNAPADSLVNYGTSTTYSASSTYSSTYVTSHTMLLTGLTPSTTYHYQIVSSDGTVATSSDQTFTTSAVLFLGHVAAGSATSGPATTPTLNTTGANFLAACFSALESGQVGNPVTDSLGNTWKLATTQNEDGDVVSSLWYTSNPVTGNDTFTAHGNEPAVSVMAFAGMTGALDQHSGSQGEYSPFTGNRISPNYPNELVTNCTAGVYIDTTSTMVTDPPFVNVDDIVFGTFPLSDNSAFDLLLATTSPGLFSTMEFVPTAAFVSTVTDSFNSSISPATLSLPSTTLPEGFVGKAYNFQFSVNGGVSPFTWTIASGTLPSGLTLTSSTGVISGTSTQSVLNSPLVFKIQDSNSSTATTSVSLTIASTSLSMGVTTCPAGTQYTSYGGCTLSASGGTAPIVFSWNTTNGGPNPPIPEGLTLNSSTGAISGVVYGEGNYIPQFIATDAKGATTTENISFAISGNNALGGCSLFPGNSIFHTNVSDLPVDTSPAAAIPSVYSSASIRPFFGNTASGNYPDGIPFIVVPWNQPLSTITTTAGPTYFTSGPIPSYAAVEGTANSNGDRHVVVIQTAGGGNPCKLWELWNAVNTGSSTWNAISDYEADLTSNQLATLQGGTTDAAGLPIAPLLANYDEVASGTINHPIRFTLQNTLHYYVWPATTNYPGVGTCTNSNGNGIPIETEISQSSPPAFCSTSAPFGEIYRLKASIPTPSQCNGDPQSLTLVQAFRNYGIILADGGLNGGLIGTPDARWSDSQLSCLTNLTLSDFEPVNVSSLMTNNESGAANVMSLSSLASSTSLTVPLSISTPIASTTTEYFVSESSTVPASSTAGWTSTLPTSHTFGTAGVTRPLYAWIEDGAGNVFYGVSSTISFPYYLLPVTSTLQAFTSPGIVTSTSASITSTPAITFNFPVEIPVGATTVSVSSGTIMTTASSSNFAAITATTTVDTSALPSNVSAVGTLQYGFSSTTISLSQPATISIPVSSAYNGESLAVYRIDAGGSWTDVTNCTVAGGVCTFSTSNFSSFAVTVPATPPPSSGGGGGGGGGGGTGFTPIYSPSTSASTSVAADEELLVSLEAQLQVLEAEVEGQSSSTSSLSGYTRNLSFGVYGPDVTRLQEFLIKSNAGPAARKLAVHGTTQAFGLLTQAALAEFQKSVGIKPAAGYFGPITRAWISGHE